MLMVNEIIEKLKDIISSDGKNGKVYDKDVADALDISHINFATMKKREKIPFDKILDFCALKKISINWLLYNQDPSSLIDSTDKYWIKFYPGISISAGGGSEIQNENFKRLDIPDYFISNLGGKEKIKNIEAINVTGESMEPTLNHNDIIFIDISKKDYHKDGIYAFYSEDGLMVKRINKLSNNQYDIISDNTIYKNYTLFKDKFTIYGKVIGSFGTIY
jgi:SOS-response transcriptional repressor LexA